MLEPAGFPVDEFIKVIFERQVESEKEMPFVHDIKFQDFKFVLQKDASYSLSLLSSKIWRNTIGNLVLFVFGIFVQNNHPN